MPVEEILIKINNDLTQLKTTVSELEKLGKVDKDNAATFQKNNAANREGLKQTGGLVGELENKYKQLGTTIVAAFGVYQIVNFAKSSFEAFGQSELSARKLNAALGSVGGTQEQYKKLLELSAALEKKTIFSHQEIEATEALATQFGFTYDTVSKLIPVISDFASATGQDLYSAMESVLRGTEGQARGLKIYGIEVKHTGDQQKDLAQITDQLTTKFKGQSEVVAGTALGAQKQLGNEWARMKEIMGKLLSEGLVPVFKFLKDLVAPTDKTSEGMKNFAKWTGVATVALIAGTIAVKADAIWKATWTTITKIAEAAQKAFNNAFKSTPWGLIIGLAAGAVAAYLEFRNTLTSLEKEQKRFNEYVADAIGASGALFEQLKDTNIKESDRAEIIKQINNTYGEYLPNLLTEKSSLKDIEDAQEAVNDKLIDNIALKLKNEEISSIIARQVEVRNDLVEKGVSVLLLKNKDIIKSAKEARQAMTETTQSALEDFRSAVSNSPLQQMDNDAISLIATYGDLQDDIDKVGDKYKLMTADIKKSLSVGTPAPFKQRATKEEEEAAKKAEEERKKANEELAKLSDDDIKKQKEVAEEGEKLLEIQHRQRDKELFDLYYKSEMTQKQADELNAGLIASQEQFNKEKIALRNKLDEQLYEASIKDNETMRKAQEEQYNKDIEEIKSQIELKYAGQKDSKEKEKALFDLEIAENKNRYEQGWIDEQTYQIKLNNLKAKYATENIKVEKKQWDEIEKIASSTLDDLFTQLQQDSENKRKLWDDQISIQDKNIDQQQKLAARGLANDLSFEETKQAELEKKKLQQDAKDKKRQKEEAAAKLALAFIEAFEKEVGTEGAPKALTDAFRTTMLASIMSKAIAATFEEGGVVGLDNNSNNGILRGRRHSAGGILVEAEDGEGVFSRKEMSNIGVANFYNMKRMLKNPISADKLVTGNNNELFNKIDELNSTFKAIPKLTYSVDGIGQLVQEEVKNHFKTTTVFKKRTINN